MKEHFLVEKCVCGLGCFLRAALLHLRGLVTYSDTHVLTYTTMANRFVFGLKPKVRSSLLFLGEDHTVVYPCGHVLIFLDYLANKQTKGH